MPHALMLAAGATAAGAAASAGARHKGRLCSRSPGCLPRAILLAPGRLPAPAAHTRAFHEGSGDDLLPGGRGRGGRMEPRRAGPGAQPFTRAGCHKAPCTRVRPRVWWGRHVSSVGRGAEWVPLPPLHHACPLTAPSTGPWGCAPSLGILLHLSSHHLWLSGQRTHVPGCAAADASSLGWRGAGAAKEGAGAGVHLQHGAPALAQSPLVKLLAWRRPWRCCRQWAAGGGALLL